MLVSPTRSPGGHDASRRFLSPACTASCPEWTFCLTIYLFPSGMAIFPHNKLGMAISRNDEDGARWRHMLVNKTCKRDRRIGVPRCLLIPPSRLAATRATPR
ncbi:hypothetical protein CC85DRAFT_52391 [Cutaneotrichosporon oleaginosum]|uniref:Uncharacterized protein n=1 Tax=Cutaneotrichosporon oleaginosum TaxID=879819 RepID=A0A0J0XQP8_9TREE|nr:uncharacterized protein CC85DRAFT_52391 [Cutaneotrichosporon oleaginosum]KLT43411.1 hypothetical protein CC85DRAFT_52391 [Cutaneotrichosporon oleaginosum]TXT05375.1 hypothetical protein COLE_06695 [Cutaneotrichosporon oleaginosum]